jgi:acyl-CoA reductase-like NAD-dependent aldehyde dehydrogenase
MKSQKAERLEADMAFAGTSGAAPLVHTHTTVASRVRVNKAYKMFVGGAFVRSESGRCFQVHHAASAGSDAAGADPETVNIPRASRKDVRDAVLVAKNAQPGWEKRTAYNRSQILYRLAEVMEARRVELVHSLMRGGVREANALTEVDVAIDRVVYYAGFADKFQALLASSNPVAGPHFGFSLPEPMGTIGVVAPDSPALLGLVSTVIPVITGANTVVALASSRDPRTAVVWSECLATSDVPAGVVNVLLGYGAEVAPHLARHREVAGLDAWIVDADVRKALEVDGADNVKRVSTRVPMDPEAWADDHRGQGLSWLAKFLETKTVWHPMGV